MFFYIIYIIYMSINSTYRLSEIDISKAKDLDEAVIEETKNMGTIEKDLSDLYDIIYELRKIINLDDAHITEIENNTNISVADISNGVEQLEEAKNIQNILLKKSYKPILLGVSIGTLVGGPIGLTCGLGYGAIITATSSGIIGGIFAKYLSNKK